MLEYLSVGCMVNTHGIKGEIKVNPATSDVSRFEYLYRVLVDMSPAGVGKGDQKSPDKNTPLKEYFVEGVRYHKNSVLIKLRNVDDMSAAEAMKGREIWVSRADARQLDKDEWFVCDILGMTVREDGVVLGKLTDVLTLSTINTQIINTQIGDRGYALLIDSRGNVVARPGITAGEKGWDESFETENLLLSNNTALGSVARDMVAGKSGTARVPFGDGEKYVAYAPLKSVNWSVAIVVPVDDVIAPAEKTRAQIVNATGETGVQLNQKMDAAKGLFVVLFILLFLMVTVLSILFAQVITRPIAELKNGSEAIGAGDLGYRVQIATGDEFEDLAQSFNTMAADLKDHIDELQRTTAEKERYAKELEIAKGIQQSFLPDTAPKIAGVEIAAKNVPALEVGGDFYDFIPLGKDQWGLVIADVSGKGVPAALFMALSRTLIRASTLANADPSIAIGHANQLICEDSKTSMFVTLFYAILDSKAMTLNYVNAGHNPPLLLKDTSSDVVLLKAKGIALGVTDEVDLQSVRVDLRPGDVLVLYTDGVTEAINDREEEFGEERLLRVIRENRALPAEDILEKILAAIIAFAGDRPQHDDITLMVLRAV